MAFSLDRYTHTSSLGTWLLAWLVVGAPVVFAQSTPPTSAVRSSGAPAASAADRDAAEAVLELERAIGRAIVAGDVAFFNSVTAADFVMTHGEAWTRGGRPALVDDRASFAKRIVGRSYAVHDYDPDTVRVEMHGDVAITYGRYVGHIPGSGPGRAWFSVWYLKAYAKRDGRWTYLSHRTVRGAHYGLDRESVASK